MSSKIKILAEMKDISLRDGLASLLAGDLSRPWYLADANSNEDADVAVSDSLSLLEEIPPPAARILLGGKPEDPHKVFSWLESPDAESVFSEIRRACAYLDITRQNAESLYPQSSKASSLETVAQSLTARIHQLVKLSEMRVSLVDQMPIGIVGVDDEGLLVLANPKAVELLGMEDIPIWGLGVDMVFKDRLSEFIADEDAEDVEITRYGQRIIVRKSPFILEKRRAGTILALWKPGAD